jgi:hypothetical protein
VLSPEALVLIVAGLLAGATGSWSPCGFSMIDTLGPAGHAGGRRTTLGACAAFAAGAPLGGVITFAGLALLGTALGAGPALGAAAAIALAGAALDAFGVPVMPQIRRQVPEPWRRVLPLPVAGGAYGVLLGMGFTTYVLSFAVPALAAVSVALADPALGVVLGVAFWIGRALPIVALAPLAERDLGAAAVTAMAERPAVLRGARLAGAAALLLCAGAFAGAEAAAGGRATVVVTSGTNPTVAPDGALAWQVPGANGRLARADQLLELPGSQPALGGPWLAYATPEGIVVQHADGSSRTIPVTGLDALAVDDRWLAWRQPNPDRVFALDLLDPAAQPIRVATARLPSTLSRPSVEGNRIVYAYASRRRSFIRIVTLPSRRLRTLRRARRELLIQPSLRSRTLVYVRGTPTSQELRLGPARLRRVTSDRRLLRVRSTVRRDAGREPGHTTQGRHERDKHSRPLTPAAYMLWATALTTEAAFVTRLRPDGVTADILRVDR